VRKNKTEKRIEGGKEGGKENKRKRKDKKKSRVIMRLSKEIGTKRKRMLIRSIWTLHLTISGFRNGSHRLLLGLGGQFRQGRGGGRPDGHPRGP